MEKAVVASNTRTPPMLRIHDMADLQLLMSGAFESAASATREAATKMNRGAKARRVKARSMDSVVA